MLIAWLVIGAVLVGAIAGGVTVLLWLRYTLLNGVAVVDTNEIDPALRAEIDRLELDYAVAEELGYGGDALLGIESKLNAAKMRAAAGAGFDPEASLTWVVAASLTPEQTLMPAETIQICPLPSVVCSFVSGIVRCGHCPPAVCVGFASAAPVVAGGGT